MDYSGINTSNFEQLLQKQSLKKPSGLYNSVLKSSAETYNAHDIIKTVNSQVKAIQKADCVSRKRCDSKDVNKPSESNFLPVNKLPVYAPCMQEVQKNNPQNCDTQCVLDTQIINIIDGAEAVNINTGMTQEFDTTFIHNDDTNTDNTKICKENESRPEILSISNVLNKTAQDSKESSLNISKNNSQALKDINAIVENQMKINMKTENDLPESHVGNARNITIAAINCEMYKTAAADTLTLDTGQCSQRSQSPVLELKYLNKKPKTFPPLVVPLETFEKFQNDALSLIEQTGFETAKHLINSQIIGKELCLDDETKILFERDSPVFDFKSEELQINSEDLEIKNIDNVIGLEDATEKRDVLKDEILFSSDEEDFTQEEKKNTHEGNDDSDNEENFAYTGDDIGNKNNEFLSEDEDVFDEEDELTLKKKDLGHKEFQDLPLTCRLEISYEKPYVLGKNMYVGFQTASNKSIQICTKSFNKAQSIFGDDDKAIEEFSLTELVQKCDKIKTNIENRKNLSTNSLNSNVEEPKPLSCFKVESLKKNVGPDAIINERANKPNCLAQNKPICDAFMSTCHKKFNLSNVTLEKCQEEFKELSKNFESIGTKYWVDKSENKNTVNEAKLDDKISDELLLQEFENIEMSLESNDDYKKEIEPQHSKTASVKKIENVKVINNDLKNIDVEIERPNINTKETTYTSDKDKSVNDTFMGFQTANNKEIKISDEALFKSKEVFQDIGKDKYTIKSIEDIISQPSTSKLFVGFKTANNKDIKISNKALTKTKHIFKDVDKQEPDLKVVSNLEQPCKSKSSYINYINNAAPRTDIKISVEEQSKNKSNLDIETQTYNLETDSKTVTNNRSSSVSKAAFVGFKTASRKNIDISDKALSKTKYIFKDIDMDKGKLDSLINVTAIPKSINSYSDNKDSKGVSFESKKVLNEVDEEMFVQCDFDEIEPIFRGFEISSEEINKASDQAIEICKKLLCDAEISIEQIDNELIVKSRRIDFMGLSTANNNLVDISKEALEQSRQVISDLDLSDIKSNDCFSRKKENNSGKYPVSICAEETLKSKNMSQDIDKIFNMAKKFTKEDEIEFRGFQTASKKPVLISTEAIARSKKIFQDIDHIESGIHLSSSKEDDVGFRGFQTASKKPVSISVEAIARSKRIFQDIDKVEKTAEKSPKKIGIEFKGFQTASKKPVSISAEAIARSKKIFQDIEKVDQVPETIPKQSEIKLKGFQTASNNSVSVSVKAIEESKKIFQATGNNISVDSPNQKQREFEGFQKASIKPVSLSAKAMAKSEKIMQDIDDVDDGTLRISSEAKAGFKGFQTDNKNPVYFGSYALIASSKLLNNNQEKSKSSFAGFKTANNQKVNISNNALAKCKSVFKDIELPIEEDHSLKVKLSGTKFKGFQTANKKQVDISEKAMAQTKSLFSDIDDFAKKGSVYAFKGFETANKNKVTVSEQALVQSRRLFSDIEKDFDISKIDNTATALTDDKTKSKVFIGFKTSSNRDIIMSSEASKKSKKVFGDDIVLKNPETKDMITKDPNDFYDNKQVSSIEGMLDTQVIRNFNENLCTEDFRSPSRPNKRSASPILVCPKAKKRKKFETPYKIKPKAVKNQINKNIEITKPANIIKFNESYKTNKEYNLEDLARLEKGKAIDRNIDPYILKFNLENILKFEFDASRNDLKEGKMVIEDIKQIFTEATDKKLIPDGWLNIHLKLILWKLISYEIRFPSTLGKVCSVKNVIDQIKYRYDKELYNAERSVLRKILEKDDVSTKTMVLCVAGIYVDGVSVASATNLNNIELLLTDGWYFIKATVDKMLSKLVYDGKIVVGSKIVACGAELVGCEQGIAPWEDTSSVRLSIFGNSTRPAKWSEKLGLRPFTMLTRLGAARVGGGKVSRLRFKVVRVYPGLYVEKFEDGSTVTRSERLEQQFQMKFEAEREATIEKIYEQVETEMSDQTLQGSQDSASLSDVGNKRKCYETGSQIAKMMKTSKDPMEFRAQLTSSQIHLLQDHVSKERDRHIQAIQDRVRERVRDRNVIQLARGRIVDLEKDGDSCKITKGLLSIWKPNDDVLDIFKEGSWVEVTNLVPTGCRNSEIQLSAGRQSVFRSIKYKDEDTLKPYLATLSRTCYDIKDLSHNPRLTTDYNEIDTVGIIFAIDPSNREFESNNQFQNVYLADIDKNMICVNFWGGIKKYGYENVLDTRQVVYCSNLQKRAGNSRINIPQYRATEFSLFTKTPKNQKGREMIDDITKKMFGLDRRKFCEDCVAVKENFSVIRSFNAHENVTPYRFDRSAYSLDKNKMFIDTPLGVRTTKKQEDFNLTGLDFESTFRQQDTQELSPKTLQRKKKVNEKIAKLKMYGEPPPLSSISIINKSKNAGSSYRSPILKSETVTSNTDYVASSKKLQGVATPMKSVNCLKSNDKDLITSPILTMNRTYVKRSGVNPVKLNFSEASPDRNVNKTVDHFAEDFDGSPPLSLE